MAGRFLGKTIDIHCGGQDLIFPHHENEIAQSECANGCDFAHYWMHNGYINVDNRKMSKSLGNFFTVRDIAKEFDLEAVRMFMLSAHYRSPINFSREMIEQAKASLDRLYTARDHYTFLMENAKDGEMGEKEAALLEKVKAVREGFDAAMDDDMNTANAIGQLFELVREANAALNENSVKSAIKAVLDTMDELTGYLRQKDVLDITTVQYAILETGGSLSVFPYPKDRPATAKEAGIKADRQYLPFTIVEDGYVSKENLRKAEKDHAWLSGVLEKNHAALGETLLLTVDRANHVVFLRKEQP